MDFSHSNDASSVLFLQIIRCENEPDECFRERLSLYSKSVDKHNMSVWQGLSWGRKMLESGKLRNKLENDLVTENPSEFSQRIRDFNPYVDSGFDIFQPSHNGTNSRFYAPHTTHLLKLGVAGAMYTLNPEEDYFNVINWEETSIQRENTNDDVKAIAHGGVFSQVISGNGPYLMNSICYDINQGFAGTGGAGGAGAGGAGAGAGGADSGGAGGAGAGGAGGGGAGELQSVRHPM